MQEKITQGNVLQLWASKYPDVERWLNHLQQKPMNAYSLYRFCEWSKLTPPELLTEKKNNPSANKIEKILDDFCSTDDKRFTNSFKYQASIAVKSFFRWNYTDLAKASGVVTLEKKKPYNALSKEGLRKLWSRTLNLRDRALIPFVTSTGIAKETLSNLTWSLLEQEWQAKDVPCIRIPPKLLKGHGLGRHKDVQQITFLTPEAKRALIDYKEWQEKRLGRKVRLEEHIWLDLRAPYTPLAYDALSSIMTRLSKETGVGFTLHDGRRWVTTCLEQTNINPNWIRKIRGRKIKGEENPYSQPNVEALRAKFREAAPLLEFTSEVSSTVDERLKAVEKIMQDMTPEQRETMQRHGIKMFSKTEAAKRKERKEKECTDGEHCQRVASEAELPELLADGWHASIVLPSGKIVVER